MNDNYVTNDIFRASALVLKTEHWPDHYYKTGEIVGGRPVIYMAWDAMPTDFVKQLEAGELLVDPVELSRVYRILRGELIKQSRGNNERTPITQVG
jgi:hypothetical protein